MLPGFAGVFGFDEGFQAGQVRAPELAVGIEPGVDGAQRFGIELVDAVAAFPVFVDQVSAAQQAQVFGDGGAGNREGAGDGAGGLAATAEKIKHGAAGGVAQCLESSFRGICNRTVSHNA